MLHTPDRSAIVPMLTRHMNMSVAEMLDGYAEKLRQSTDGLMTEQLRPLRKSLRDLNRQKRDLKNLRRRETICLRRAEPPVAGIKLSTSFHRTHNALRQLLYGLMRIAEPAREHVDNNFSPIEPLYAERYCRLRNMLEELLHETADNLRRGDRYEQTMQVALRCKEVQRGCQQLAEAVGVDMQTKNMNLNTTTLMLHLAQETELLAAELRELLKAGQAFKSLTENSTHNA